MFCPSCGSDIPVELKYCNRCGANLSAIPVSYSASPPKPLRLGLPTIVLGLTVIIGLAAIFDGAKDLAEMHLHPAAIAGIVIFGLATLFGCSALMLRFWLKVVLLNRESYQPQTQAHAQMQFPSPQKQFSPPREPVPSVTEHTTRTFSSAYRETSDPQLVKSHHE